MSALKYLTGYPPPARPGPQAHGPGPPGALRARYPQGPHGVRTDRQLYDYVVDLKNAYIRNGDPISKVAYDSKIQVMQHALGQHTYVSRVQGGKLKAKHEIRVATLFRNLPEEFLRMIVVHELAHLKEKSTTRRSMACASAWNHSITSTSSTCGCI